MRELVGVVVVGESVDGVENVPAVKTLTTWVRGCVAQTVSVVRAENWVVAVG